MSPKRTEHSFSIEMDSIDSISNLSLSDRKTEVVLVQGELGKLIDLSLLDDVSLEVKGSKGTLRLDLSREEINDLLGSKTGRDSGSY
jgi:hypothetical protein